MSNFANIQDESSRIQTQPISLASSPLICNRLPSQQTINDLHQGYGNYFDFINESESMQGYCLLKTKADRYKEHWCQIQGNELYCYRSFQDFNLGFAHKVMHSIVGTFIKEMPSEYSESEGCLLFPLKIILPPNKSRLLYFKDSQLCREWIACLKETVGDKNIFDFYTFLSDLGKGQFGLVKLAVHQQTG